MITNEYRISKNHEYKTRQLKEIAVQQREELKEEDRGIERESLDAIRKYLKISHAVNFNKDISGDCQLPHGKCLKHHQLQQTKEYLSSGEREYREELY